jgi:hypothetical protein
MGVGMEQGGDQADECQHDRERQGAPAATIAEVAAVFAVAGRGEEHGGLT